MQQHNATDTNIQTTNPFFLNHETTTTTANYTSVVGGEGGQRRSPTMASFLHINNNTNNRYLGFTKQHASEPNLNNHYHDPFEFDESDVVWSPSDRSDTSDTGHSHSPPPTLSSSPTNLRRLHHHHLNHHNNHPFPPDKSGLSAALSDDHHTLIRRKSALNPSISAASRAIPRSDAPSGPKFHQSAPVNVPIWPNKKFGESRNGRLGNLEEETEVDGDEEDEEMVPPHEIVARSHVTFSVFEGVGRTLKGRDLRRVRNAVFLKTGFID